MNIETYPLLVIENPLDLKTFQLVQTSQSWRSQSPSIEIQTVKHEWEQKLRWSQIWPVEENPSILHLSALTQRFPLKLCQVVMHYHLALMM